MICRFYPGYTLDKVEGLTIKQFEMLNANMVEILRMENPTPEEEKGVPLTASNLKAAAARNFK